MVQAYILDGLLKKIESKVNVTIELDTSTLIALKRLSARSKTEKARTYDMSTDVIIHRLEEWEGTIKTDVSSFYANQGKLIQMDGSGEDEEVFKNIDDAVSKLIIR